MKKTRIRQVLAEVSLAVLLALAVFSINGCKCPEGCGAADSTYRTSPCDRDPSRLTGQAPQLSGVVMHAAVKN